MDRSHLLRFISNHSRHEADFVLPPPPKKFNDAAGKEVIRYLRVSEGYQAPILIHSVKGELTEYIEAYNGVKTTTEDKMLLEFCRAMAERRSGD